MSRVKYTLLIPLNYNDGSAVPESVMAEIQNEIMNLADGYTLAGTVTGAYRMKDGSKQVDRSITIWIAIEPSREASLRRLVGVFARRLQQEALYLECSSGSVEFVPAQVDEDQK